jgi:hypothetical protein
VEQECQKLSVMLEPVSPLEKLVVYFLMTERLVALLGAHFNVEHHLLYKVFELACLRLQKEVLIGRLSHRELVEPVVCLNEAAN